MLNNSLLLFLLKFELLWSHHPAHVVGVEVDTKFINHDPFHGGNFDVVVWAIYRITPNKYLKMGRKLVLFLCLELTSTFRLALGGGLHDVAEWGFRWRMEVLRFRLLHILGFGKSVVVASVGFAF